MSRLLVFRDRPSWRHALHLLLKSADCQKTIGEATGARVVANNNPAAPMPRIVVAVFGNGSVGVIAQSQPRAGTLIEQVEDRSVLAPACCPASPAGKG